jgi:hypothetical protein
MSGMARRPTPGAVIEIALPNGRYAYARTYRDASVAVYQTTSDEAGNPPVGSRDFRFLVGLDDTAFRATIVRIVGRDEFGPREDDWPPPASIRDPISGAYSIYHHGEIKPSSPLDAADLEPAAAWSIEQVIERIMRV